MGRLWVGNARSRARILWVGNPQSRARTVRSETSETFHEFAMILDLHLVEDAYKRVPVLVSLAFFWDFRDLLPKGVFALRDDDDDSLWHGNLDKE